MSLNWDMTKVKDYTDLHSDGERAITDTLIWATMSVGIRSITEANYVEFFRRVKYKESMLGAVMQVTGEDDKPKDFPVTLEHVRRRIGLSTNADSKTQSQFEKWCSKLLWQNVNSSVDKQQEEELAVW